MNLRWQTAALSAIVMSVPCVPALAQWTGSVTGGYHLVGSSAGTSIDKWQSPASSGDAWAYTTDRYGASLFFELNGAYSKTWTGDPTKRPTSVWIEERASSSVTFVPASGQRTSSTQYSSIGAPVPGTEVRCRYYELDVTSDTIALTGEVSASGYMSPADKGSMNVTIGWSWGIVKDASSIPTADRKAVAPPWRNGPPMFGGNLHFSPAHGGCWEGSDPVDLATGEHIYVPCADISVYNPNGLSLSYQRNFLSKVAKDGYKSPGQSTGWVDTYDIRIASDSPGTWGSLTLTYPNSATEMLTPALDGNGVPTGQFTGPAGAEYFVEGVPSGATGQWQSISVTFKDQTKWTLTPTTTNYYALTRITDRMGHWISINRNQNSGYRVETVTDNSSPSNTLLSFAYNADGYLESVTDAYQRKIIYTYGQSAGATCLLAVSQIGPSSASTIPARWSYGYTAYVDPTHPLNPAQPHITSISFPSPTGSGISTQSINYDSTTARVASIVDANGNQTVFSYVYTDGTRVTVKNPQGEVDATYIANFDPKNGNISTGATDAKGYDVFLIYGDANNPDKPTTIIDKEGRRTSFTYDSFGNVLTVTDPRGTTTTNTISYADFPLGRVTSVQEGTKTATGFTYYEPSGLVHVITTPQPGTTDGSTVTTSFTHDSLGNVLTRTAPGNNATTTIMTTYNYTTDGTYTQPARFGEPLTVTDNLHHITHYRYDERGNLLWTQDALGFRTDFTYNIADQLTTTLHPSAGETP